MKMHIRKLILCSLFFLVALNTDVFGQVVYENPKHEIYSFLSRQAQKGNIRIDDYLQPYSRKEIAEKLIFLKDSVTSLTNVEKDEVDFYLKEFSEFNETYPDSIYFLKKDFANRLRGLELKKDGFWLRADPAIITDAVNGTGQSYTRVGTGVNFYGLIGKHFGFQFAFLDITERGNGIDSVRAFNNLPGIVRTEGINKKSLNYADFRGAITYGWKNGSVAIGQDNLLFGYGENGRLVLSDKAPAYPFIRLDYKPLKWLHFNYSHSFLQSGVIDSARTYNKGNDIYGTGRQLWVPKYMASHSLTILPIKGFSFTVGESIIYSDQLQAGYLFPLMFFKVYDQYASRYKITTGSNGQFFFQASSRNHLKNTHLYATLFIDEIRTTEMFNPAKSRNQLGFNFGASVTDVGIKYLTIGAEYTRTNPFVYQNLVPAQYYTNQNYPLGDWMGANADRLLAFIKYTPMARLKTSFYFQNIRKGNPGSLFDQYFAEPQPKFLDDFNIIQYQFQFNASYELLNNLYVNGNLTWMNHDDILNQPKQTYKTAQIGLRLGI